MGGPPAASITKQAAAQWAGQLLSSHSLRLARIEWIPGYGGSATARDDGVVLTLGELVLQDAATMRFHIAHEVGHVALGHTAGLRRRQLRLTGISVAITLVLEGGVMAAAVLWSWPIVLVPVVLLGAMGVLSRGAVLPLERAADEFAAAHGAPASSASMPPTPWLSRWVLKTHPTQRGDGSDPALAPDVAADRSAVDPMADSLAGQILMSVTESNRLPGGPPLVLDVVGNLLQVCPSNQDRVPEVSDPRNCRY